MQIKFNKADLAKIDLMLAGIKGAYPRVIYRSINSTTGTSKTFASREIAGVLNLTITRIKKDFKQIKAGPGVLKGSLIAKGKPVNLASFKGTKQTLKGISVLVLVGHQRKVIKHAFLWSRTTKSGSTAKTAFWRSRIYKRPYRRNFPYGRAAHEFPPMKGTKEVGGPGLETLTGPRIEDIYSRSQLLDKVLKFSGDKYIENVNRNFTYELSKL